MLGDPRRLATALLVLAGVLASHAAAYVIAHPDPVLRAAALGRHGYLDLLNALAVPAVAAGLLWLAVQHARRHRAPDLGVVRLAAWQATLFLAVEVLERVPGGHLHSIVDEPALLVGLVLQVPIAALLVGAVRAVGRVIAALRQRRGPRLERPGASSLLAPVMPFTVDVFLSSFRRRGPPAAATR